MIIDEPFGDVGEKRGTPARHRSSGDKEGKMGGRTVVEINLGDGNGRIWWPNGQNKVD